MVRTQRAFLDELGIRASCRGGRRIARRHAGVRVGDSVSRSGRCGRGDRQHARSRAAGARVERDRTQRDHGRSRVAGWSLLRNRPQARRGDGHRADGRAHHVSVGEIGGGQVRAAVAVCRGCPLHHDRARVPGRELPSASGGIVRQAIRCEHLSLHVARADIFRSGEAIRHRAVCRMRFGRCRRGRC